MDSTSILVVSISVSSYIVLGILFICCIRAYGTPRDQKLQYLDTIVSKASHSIEHRHPAMHPKEKKAQITQLVEVTLREMQYQENAPFTIDMLIDDAMLSMDTDPRLQTIRFSNETTRQVTPPLGMLQLGARHKAEQRTGKTGVLR